MWLTHVLALTLPETRCREIAGPGAGPDPLGFRALALTHPPLIAAPAS